MLFDWLFVLIVVVSGNDVMEVLYAITPFNHQYKYQFNFGQRNNNWAS